MEQAQRAPTRKSGEMLITPLWARQQLNYNAGNRALDRLRVSQYAAEIRAGRWRPGVAVVAIDWNGNLINGQHTLHAIVEADTAVIVDLKTGCDPEDFAAYDIGKVRNSATVLQKLGFEDTKALGPAVRWAMVLERGTYGETRAATTLPVTAVKAELDARPGLVDAVKAALRSKNLRRLIAGSLLGAALYEFRRYDSDRADEFLVCLETGANLADGHPVLALRNRLLEGKASQVRAPSQELLAFLIRAWTLFLAGENVSFIKGSVRGKDGRRIYPQLPRA